MSWWSWYREQGFAVDSTLRDRTWELRDRIQERRRGRREWARARSLPELGEVTARWLEGEFTYHPNGYGEGPDPETTGLVPALAQLNRGGFVTSGSQPGEGPVWGFGGRVWWQRAAVDGFTDSATAEWVQAAGDAAGLIVVRNGRAGWRTHWRNSTSVTAADRDTVGDRAIGHTEFGAHLSKRAVRFGFDGYGSAALCSAEQVTVIDPVWGRNNLLWPTLTGISPRATRTRYSVKVYDPSGDVKEHRCGLEFGELGELYTALDSTGYQVEITGWESVRLPLDDEIDRVVAECERARYHGDGSDCCCSCMSSLRGLYPDLTDQQLDAALVDRRGELARTEPQERERIDHRGLEREHAEEPSEAELVSGPPADAEREGDLSPAGPAQYLGYTDGELVRDARSGARGHVRVRDDEETGRYAEIQWDGSFVSDELELAIANGLQRASDDHEPALTLAVEQQTDAGYSVVTARDLQPGQRILVGPGDIRTVTDCAEYDQYGGVSIVTDKTVIITQLPCLVKVIDDEAEQKVEATRDETDPVGVAPSQEIAEPEPGLTLDEPEHTPCAMRESTPPPNEKDAFTEEWVAELRSGRHRQVHGAWELPAFLCGPDKECTIQVAKNHFDVTLDHIRDLYGGDFVSDVLHKNDVQRQSFDQIGDWIEATQLRGRPATDMERDR